MKTGIRILTIVLATMMILTSSVMALPNNTVVVGNQAFSLDALRNGVGDVQSALNAAHGKLYYSLDGVTDGFKGLFSGTPMTQAQTDELSNIKYYNGDGSSVTYAHFNDELPVEVQGLTVVNVKVDNSEQIEITFSDGVTKTYYVEPALSEGDNTVEFTYLGKQFSKIVTYHAPITASRVEKVEFVNYRYIKVTFNTVVDAVSAANAANYYFEIVDGNAAFGAYPDLKLSNQLSKIETNYPGGAVEWWKHNISSRVEGGKTLVDIYLPEDARFTTLLDKASFDQDIDDERTLTVFQRSSMPERPGDRKYLIKNTEVNVAVRNVLDAAGKATIDTVVKPILIYDEVRPVLQDVSTSDGASLISSASGLGENLGTFELYRTRDGYQTKQDLEFTYSEPVFDAHILDKSDFERYRDINLYVNGRLVASTIPAGSPEAQFEDLSKVLPLNEVVSFDMTKEGDYADARVMTINAERAVQQLEDEWGEDFLPNKNYEFRIVGVTDLAGNIEVSSQHKFIVRFIDKAVTNPVIVPPVVLGIEQVGDNMFRVEFNRAGAYGKLEIQNADGNGGILNVDIPASVQDGTKFYSYVQVWAIDNELLDPLVNLDTIEKDNLLVYDGNDYIIRDVKAKDIKADPDLKGNDYPKQMTLYDDIQSPVVASAQLTDIAYANRTPVIEIPVKDMVPQSWASDDNAVYSVRPVLYKFDPLLKRYLNDVDFATGAYLPVFVWYLDADGRRHSALVNNQEEWLRPHDFFPSSVIPDDYLNHGHPGSIDFVGTNDNNYFALKLNLENYPELLDADGDLVAGVTYNVEIPKGYFTDDGRDIIPYFGDELSAASLRSTICDILGEHDFHFGDGTYDLLYVDDARIPQLASLVKQIIDGTLLIDRCTLNITELGYTSIKQVASVFVKNPDPTIPPAMTVPQTAKELIWYDEAQDTINVEFTGDIADATLKDPNNYTVNGKKLSEYGVTSSDIVFDVSHDKQFAVIRMPEDTIAEDGDYAFRVEGVSNPVGGTMTPVDTVISLHDNTHPYILTAKMTAQREIQLSISEPIKYFVEAVPTADKFSAAKNFKVNNGAYTVLEAIQSSLIDPNGRTIVLKLGQDLPLDGAGLTVSVVVDQNGQILFVDDSTNLNTMKIQTINVTK